MTTTIQAIPTEYNGVRYDSQLEARWAVFFEEVGIPYHVGTREAFAVFSARKGKQVIKHYTPDFVFEAPSHCVEVKGSMSSVTRSLLSHYCHYVNFNPKGILFLSNVPTPRPIQGQKRKYKSLWHPLIYSMAAPPGSNPGLRILCGQIICFLLGSKRRYATPSPLYNLGQVRRYLEEHEKHPVSTDTPAPDKVVDAYFKARQYDFR